MIRALRISTFTAALLVLGGAMSPAAAQISVQFRWGTRGHPLRGGRFEAMRLLAHELDGRAQHAVDEVAAINRGSRADRKLLSAVTDFAGRAERFHERIDAYQTRPWDLPDEVEGLTERARRVNDRFRGAHVTDETVRDWQATRDVLNRMQRLLAGEEVPVSEPRRWDHDRDYDQHRDGYDRWQRDGYRRDDEPRNDFGYGNAANRYFPNEVADEVRRIARELEQRADRMSDPRRGYPVAWARSFVESARQLRAAAEEARLERSVLRPLVERVVEDIRSGDFAGSDLPGLASRLDQLMR